MNLHLNRLGLDAGTQYRAVIFFRGAEQANRGRRAEERVQRRFRKQDSYRNHTSEFYRAEEYHRHFDRKNGLGL